MHPRLHDAGLCVGLPGQAQSAEILGEFAQVAGCLTEACPDQTDNACATAALSEGGACFDILTACIDGTLGTDGADGTDVYTIRRR